jgi:hypothetical protein
VVACTYGDGLGCWTGCNTGAHVTYSTAGVAARRGCSSSVPPQPPAITHTAAQRQLQPAQHVGGLRPLVAWTMQACNNTYHHSFHS